VRTPPITVQILTGLDEIETVDDVIDGAVSVQSKSSIVRLQSVLERRVTRRHRVNTKQCTCSSNQPTSASINLRAAPSHHFVSIDGFFYDRVSARIRVWAYLLSVFQNLGRGGVRPIYSCPLSLLPPVPSPPLQSLACPSLPCHFIPSLLFPMPPSLQSIQLRSLEDLHARLCRMHRVCGNSFESRFDEINILTRNQHTIQMLGLFWQESLMVLDTDMDPRDPLTKYLKLTLLW